MPGTVQWGPSRTGTPNFSSTMQSSGSTRWRTTSTEVGHVPQWSNSNRSLLAALRQLPGRARHRCRTAGLRRREVCQTGCAQGPPRPDQRVSAQPEHPPVNCGFLTHLRDSLSINSWTVCGAAVTVVRLEEIDPDGSQTSASPLARRGRNPCYHRGFSSTPGGTRTPNLLIRRSPSRVHSVHSRPHSPKRKAFDSTGVHSRPRPSTENGSQLGSQDGNGGRAVSPLMAFQILVR